MKKSFLMLGVLGSICAIDGYADVVISQDTPDMTITVARAGKAQAKTGLAVANLSDAAAIATTEEGKNVFEVPVDELEVLLGNVGTAQDTVSVADDAYRLQCPRQCRLRCKKTNQGSAMVCYCKGRGNSDCPIKGHGETIQDF